MSARYPRSWFFCAGLLSGWLLTGLLFSQDEVQVGYAVLEPGPVATSPVASALFSSRSGEVLIAEAAVAAVEPSSAGRVFVDQGANRTGIALANIFDREISVTLTLRDAQGGVFSEETLSFSAREQKARFVEELFRGIPSQFIGSLSYSTEKPADRLAAVTIRQTTSERGEQLLATLPVVDLDQNEQQQAQQALVFPHIGVGGGVLSTQLLLINRTAVTIQGEIRLVSSSGDPLQALYQNNVVTRIPFTLPGNGIWQGTLTGGEQVSSGYAVVTRDGPGTLPAGTAIFQFRGPQSGLISEAGVAAIPATRKARIYVDTIDTRTGVALASPGNASARVDFEMLDRYGIPVTTASRTLAAEGHLAVFSDELFPELPAGFTGLLEIRSQFPIVPISLKLTTNDRGDPILTTLPVADLNRTVSPRTLVFPQVGFGAGFSTRLVFISTDLSQELEGSLNFVQSSGSSLKLPLLGEVDDQFSFQIPPGGGRQLRPGNDLSPASIILDPNAVDSTETVVNQGQVVQIRPLILDTSGSFRDDFELTFSSITPAVADIDDFGRISGIQPGFSTIFVSTGTVVESLTATVVQINSGTEGFSSRGLARDQSGRFYLADTTNHTILKADSLSETPNVYAGIFRNSGLRDGLRLDSLFSEPAFLTIDKVGSNLYVSDSANHVIRLVEPGAEGRVSVFAGQDNSVSFRFPQGLKLDDQGFLWLVDSGNHVIRRINPIDRSTVTVAGSPGIPGFRDGQGEEARFSSPAGMALISPTLAQQLEGELFQGGPSVSSVLVADSGNGAIRRVTSDGLVETLATTVAGTSSGSTRTQVAQIFDRPNDVAIDPFGNVYVTEPDQGRVRVLLENGKAVDVGQTGTFARPWALAIDQAGRLTVADADQSIREVVYGAPDITSIEPEIIPASGGSEVTIKGRNFAPDTVVIIGSVVIQPIQLENSETIRLKAQPLPSGKITVTVQNRGGLDQAPLILEPPPLTVLTTGQIATVAGGSTFSQDGSQATQAPLASPRGVAIDALGNLFISDTQNNKIRRVDSRTGIITTVAGRGQSGFSGDGGPGVAAELNFPTGLSVDILGNLLIADSSNNRVRRVNSSTGVIDTSVGNGLIVPFAPLGDGGPALNAAIGLPEDITTDSSNNLYIADSFQHRIRFVDNSTGNIDTVAGNGTPQFSGDGGNAKNAAVNSPNGVAIGPQGHLFFSDTFNHRVRKVDKGTGVITTIAGTGQAGLSGDGGPATQARLNVPIRIAVNPNGDLFIADSNNGRIRKVDEDGVITTVAGGANGSQGIGDGGAATEAFLALPNDVATDAAGNLLIADTFNNKIRQVSASTGIISTFAGVDSFDYLGDGDPAVYSFLSLPVDVAVRSDGLLLIADQLVSRIRSVDPLSGIISTVAGGGDPRKAIGEGEPAISERLLLASGVDVDVHGDVYIADGTAIRRIEGSTGLMYTAAGGGFPPDGIGDGLYAPLAGLNFAIAVAVDDLGSLYVVDSVQNRVRWVNGITDTITTVAGGGTPADGLGDGLSGDQAALSLPSAVALDSSGNLFIADTFNNRIRRVDATTGIITTAAGSGQSLLSIPTPPLGDGGNALEAAVSIPTGVAVDASGNLFIVDGSGRIRRVDALTGIITTIAGGGNPEDGIGDLLPATDASLGLGFPNGLDISSSGDLYLSEAGTKRVRIVRGAAPSGPARGSIRDSALFDNAERGRTLWTADNPFGSTTWNLDDSDYRSPSHSWFSAGVDGLSDQTLALNAPLSLREDASLIWLTFWHRFDFEVFENSFFDGGVVEVSIDGGANWWDLEQLFIANGYNGFLNSFSDGPLAGRSAFTGASPDTLTLSAADLTAFAGSDLLIRFRAGSDSSFPSGGWWIDDIKVSVFYQ